MVKALLKKQLLETLSFFLIDAKNGKRRSKGAVIGFGVLMLYVVVVMIAMFYMMAEKLCLPLVNGGLAWVYFAFFAAMATAFAVVGTIFAVRNKLYEAKDNDLLFSMPIKPWAVLFSRMFGLYVTAFFSVALIYLPAVVCYCIQAVFSALTVLFALLSLVILPLGAVALSCVLGFLLALLTRKLRAKNLFTLLFSLAFFVLYFWAYSKINTYLSYLLTHGAAVGNTIKAWLFPFWLFGLGASGKALSFLGFAGIFIGVFALVYFLLSVTYVWLVTQKRGEQKATYKENKAKQSSVLIALLKKETFRFCKNPLILLNSMLGAVFFLLLPVLLCLNKEMVQLLTAGGKDLKVLLLAGLLAMVSTMNGVTASSISLEGESVWIVRSSPVKTGTVFAAKLLLHILVTAVLATICHIVLSVLLALPVSYALLVWLAVMAVIVLTALSGLAINLKFPNLHWTNEVAAVKQSLSPMVSIFAGWGVVLTLALAYVLLRRYLPVWAFLCMAVVLLAVGSLLLCVWLKRRGEKLFEEL
ncbi:MAG: hypothetical protein IJX88_02650 [Clostridia bacterium]|nr:hypothetical protein [Clostridia bacterium]